MQIMLHKNGLEEEEEQQHTGFSIGLLDQSLRCFPWDWMI